MKKNKLLIILIPILIIVVIIVATNINIKKEVDIEENSLAQKEYGDNLEEQSESDNNLKETSKKGDSKLEVVQDKDNIVEKQKESNQKQNNISSNSKNGDSNQITSENNTEKKSNNTSNQPSPSKPTPPPASNIEESRVERKSLPNNVPVYYDSNLENQVVSLVNQFRNSNGLSSLYNNEGLRESARYKSNSMFQLKYFGHGNPQYDGAGPSYLMERVYGIKASYYSENILNRYGESDSPSAQIIFEQWKNSPPHKEAMLSQKAKKIGVGIAINKVEKTIDGDNIVIYNTMATQHFTD